MTTAICQHYKIKLDQWLCSVHALDSCYLSVLSSVRCQKIDAYVGHVLNRRIKMSEELKIKLLHEIKVQGEVVRVLKAEKADKITVCIWLINNM